MAPTLPLAWPVVPVADDGETDDAAGALEPMELLVLLLPELLRLLVLLEPLRLPVLPALLEPLRLPEPLEVDEPDDRLGVAGRTVDEEGIVDPALLPDVPELPPAELPLLPGTVYVLLRPLPYPDEPASLRPMPEDVALAPVLRLMLPSGASAGRVT